MALPDKPKVAKSTAPASSPITYGKGPEPKPPSKTLKPSTSYRLTQSGQHFLTIRPKQPALPSIEDIQEGTPFGLPPDWDYQAADKGPHGEQQGPFQQGWDPRGRPYYGPGILGYLTGVASRLQRPIEETPDLEEIDVDLQQVTGPAKYVPGLSNLAFLAQNLPTITTAADVLARRASNLGRQEGTEVGLNLSSIPTLVGRGASEFIRGGLALLQQPAALFERYVGGTAMALEELAGTAPQREPAQPLFFEEGRMASIETAMRNLYLPNIHPIGMGVNALRAGLQVGINKKPLEEVIDVLDLNTNAARILYTSAIDPLAREEFIRRVQGGASPDLLAMELENPIAEAIGQTLFDPLNIIASGTARARDVRQTGSVADEFIKVADDGVRAALDNLGGIAERTFVVAPSGEATIVDSLDDLVRAKMAATAKRSAGLDDFARDTSAFALTSDGKRFNVARRAEEMAAWIAHNSDSPEETLEIYRGLQLAASDDPGKVALGLDIMGNFKAPRPLHSRAGEELGIILDKVMGDSPSRFLDDLTAASEGRKITLAGRADKLHPRLKAKLQELGLEVREVDELKFAPGVEGADAARGGLNVKNRRIDVRKGLSDSEFADVVAHEIGEALDAGGGLAAKVGALGDDVIGELAGRSDPGKIARLKGWFTGTAQQRIDAKEMVVERIREWLLDPVDFARRKPKLAEFFEANIGGVSKGEDSSQIARMVEFADQKMSPVIDGMFPSIAERVAAGEEINPILRGLAKFDGVFRSAVMRPVNQFFASVYMGMTPGYAFRNLLTNTLHILVDEGRGAFRFRPSTWQAKSAEWLGGRSPKAFGFGAVSAANLKPSNRPWNFFLKLSEKMESGARAQVTGHSIENTMRSMMRPGRAIPDIKPLIDAGLSKELSGVLHGMFLDFKGDVPAIQKAFAQAGKTGSIETFRQIGTWASPEDIVALERLGLYDDAADALRAVGPDEGSAILQQALQEIRDEAATVADEVAHVSRESEFLDDAVALGEARSAGFLSEQTLKATQSRFVAVENANFNYRYAVDEFKDQVLVAVGRGGAEKITLPDGRVLTIQQAADEVLTKYRPLLGELQSTGVVKRREFWQKIFNYRDEINGLPADTAWDGIWRQIGIPGDPPPGLTKAQLRNALFEDYARPVVDKMAQGTRDTVAVTSEAFAKELGYLVGIEPNTALFQRARESYRVSMTFDSSAVFKDNRIYKFGPFEVSQAEGINNSRHALNAINANLPPGVDKFESLWKVPPAIGRQALEKRALSRAQEVLKNAEAVTVEEIIAKGFTPEVAEQMLAGKVENAVRNVYTRLAPDMGLEVKHFDAWLEKARRVDPPAEELSKWGSKEAWIDNTGADVTTKQALEEVAEARGLTSNVRPAAEGTDEIKEASRLVGQRVEDATTGGNPYFRGTPGSGRIYRFNPDDLNDTLRANFEAMADILSSQGKDSAADAATQIAEAFRSDSSEVAELTGLFGEGIEIPESAADSIVAQLFPESGSVPVPDAEARQSVIRLLLDEDATVENLIPPYTQGSMPSNARAWNENLDGIEKLFTRLDEGMRANWGASRPVVVNDEVEAALKVFFKQAEGNVAEARLLASQVANARADFTLLLYPEKRNIDMALQYIYPYHFWYNRTYMNWMRRTVSNPNVLAAYGRYRQTLEKIHAGAPEWWKYNINSDELLGIETDHPLFFNLEQTLNPLQGIIGVDFDDPVKRTGWFTAALQEANKLGPSTWTPLSLVTALALYIQGEDEAAERWAGVLIPQTTTLRTAATLATGQPVAANLPYFLGGMGPFERRRVGRAIAAMDNEGLHPSADLIDAAFNQKGPLWDEAIVRQATERGPGQLASFFAGVGFKARTRSDMEIDQFYTDYYSFWAQEPNYSPEEIRNGLEALRQKYPFMDTLLLSRKGGLDRDRAFAYNVLARIPPAQSDDFAEIVGVDARLLSRFYDDKGHIEKWPESDRDRFMSAMIDLGTILDIPREATREEWNSARSAYGSMLDSGKTQFGENIWERVDAYFGSKTDEAGGGEMAKSILANDPAIGDALDWRSLMIMRSPTMAAYYTSIEKIESYYKGRMYDAIEKELGEDIWLKWDVWHFLKDTGQNKEANAFWKANPELDRYGDLKDAWIPLVDQKAIQIGQRLPDGIGATQREIEGELGLGAQDVRENFPQVGPGSITPEMIQSALGPNAFALALDALEGEDLPQVAQDKLDAIARNMGLQGWRDIIGLLEGLVPAAPLQ